MYFNYSIFKLFSMVTLVALLIIAVEATLSMKSERYGESRFGQIIERTVGGAARFATYVFRREDGLKGLAFSGYDAGGVGNRESTRGIPVLTYHAIIPGKEGDVPPESFEGHNVGLSEFEDQMFTLKRAGWETVTLDEFDGFMRGEREIPEKSFLLTFDDGAKDSYYPVDPLLSALGYEAVTFVIPFFSQDNGTYYYLSENELARAKKNGRWDIGAHGFHSHTVIQTNREGSFGAALANRRWLSDEGRLESIEEYAFRVREDLALSRDKLEDMFSEPVYSFAFPFGEFGQNGGNTAEAHEILRGITEELFDYSFYQWWPGIGYRFNYPEERETTEMVKRIRVHPTWDGAALLTLLENGNPKMLPYVDTFDQDRGWLTTWGPFHIEDSALTLSTELDAGGASVILDGTRHWENYTVRVDAVSPERTSLNIIVRYKDNDNHAQCNIGNGFAHVEQIIAGERRTIRGERSPAIAIPEGPFTMEATVDGRTVICSLNGSVLVESDFLDRSLETGGVGIKIWDEAPGRASVEVDMLTVSEIQSSSSASGI